MNSEKTLYKANPCMFRNNPVGFAICIPLCVVGIGIGIFLVWWLRCKNTTLTISAEKTVLRTGILSKRINEVWHRDVRNVQISQAFLQRIFGVGTIGISSSGQSGIEIGVRGIPDPYQAKSIIDEQRRITIS